MRAFLLAVCLLLSACSASPQRPIPDTRAEIRDLSTFRKSPTNSYALVIKGQIFLPPKGVTFLCGEALWKGEPVEDRFVNNDVQAIGDLALSKGFDTYFVPMATEEPVTVFNLIDRIAQVSDRDTRVLLTYSGEGDKHGLRCRSCSINDKSTLLTAGEMTLDPPSLTIAMTSIKGRYALIVSACESGCIVESARRNPNFQGVVIAACDVGFATTPYEPTNHTALMSTFLGFYEDPKAIKNLATVEFGLVGGVLNNMRHKWVDFWQRKGLPISYASVTFSSADFLF